MDTCMVNNTEPHVQLLSSSVDGASVVVAPLRRDAASTFLSTLRLWLATQDQSGRYHCIPTNTPQASVIVHVLDGK